MGFLAGKGCVRCESRLLASRPQRTAARLTRSALFVLALCTTALANAGKPIVYQTGYEIGRLQGPSLFWIDEKRLLFAGIKTSEMDAAIAAKETDREERLRKLYLWEADTKAVRFYANAQGVCVSDGIVRYRVAVNKERGTYTVREGPFGVEKEIEKLRPSNEELSMQGQRARVRSTYTCRTHLRKELSPPALEGRRIIVLREGHGYLDAGPERTQDRIEEIRTHGATPIKLYRPGIATPIDLPITLEQGPGAPIYSPYLDIYVTHPRPKGSDPGRVTSWPKNLPFKLYTFKPTGETNEVTVPYGDWASINGIQPTRGGWIFGGHGESRSKGGLFIFHGQSVKRIEAGQVYGIAVSPDGCRSAVAIQNKHLEMGTPINVKIFDFCR